MNPWSDLGDAEKQGLTREKYWIGVAILLGSAYLQYFVKGFGPIPSLVIIYGIPVAAVSVLFGSPILQKAFANTGRALKLGLGLFGVFSLSGIVVAALILTAILSMDPGAESLLHKPNPVLHIPHEFAWVMVLISLLVVGPVEEYLFRGFVYGGLLTLLGTRHWFRLALLSSALFALAHLYYALVYGIASLAMFAELLFLSIAFAMTFYLTGGNLFVPALLHGLYDATGFLGVAVSPQIGSSARMGFTAIGIVTAAALFFGRWNSRPDDQDRRTEGP